MSSHTFSLGCRPLMSEWKAQQKDPRWVRHARLLLVSSFSHLLLLSSSSQTPLHNQLQRLHAPIWKYTRWTGSDKVIKDPPRLNIPRDFFYICKCLIIIMQKSNSRLFFFNSDTVFSTDIYIFNVEVLNKTCRISRHL